MSAPDLDAIQARVDAHNAADTLQEIVGSSADLHHHAPADLAALLAEVKRLTAERDEARAALAALRGDVEALAVRIFKEGDAEDRETAHDLAAVLANHPTTKEARDE